VTLLRARKAADVLYFTDGINGQIDGLFGAISSQ
jgi:hypothetical protein